MLFAIAYNMLGSIADAEDMVQETYASWLESDKSYVLNPKFYLIRTVSNKCISHLKKLKQQRETYKGTWLPDPLASATEADDIDKLSIGFLYLLEKLTPLERGVLILRESFDLEYEEICRNFNISHQSCRQHLSRAKKKLSIEKVKIRANKQQHEKALHKFLDACLSRNLQALVDLLRQDVTVYADGGGNARAVPKPVYGKEHVLKLLMKGMEKAEPFVRSEFITINGLGCGAFYLSEEESIADLLITIDTDEKGSISNVYFLANPDKLKYLSRKP
jgi:RNA polymerase sigma-70 factor (ECF subfamily)